MLNYDSWETQELQITNRSEWWMAAMRWRRAIAEKPTDAGLIAEGQRLEAQARRFGIRPGPPDLHEWMLTRRARRPA